MPLKLGGVALLLAVSATAHAQATSKPAAPPSAPSMSAEGKKFLQAWVGQWTSNDATMTSGDQKMQGSLKMNCESVSSGWGTLCRGTFDIKGQPPSAATFLMGWDIATGEGHMFEVADTAEVHDHAGKWVDDKTISLVRNGKSLDGKDETDDCRATWASARELKLACTGTQAGATVWTFTSTCRK
jgi:hypothetical protein